MNAATQINYNTGRRSLAFTCASHLQEFYEGSRVVDESVAMWPLDFLMEIQRALKYGSVRIFSQMHSLFRKLSVCPGTARPVPPILHLLFARRVLSR